MGEEEKIPFLQSSLPDLWCAAYAIRFPDSNPMFIDIKSFQVIFDLTSKAEEHSADWREDRVIAVHGLSTPPQTGRDAARMRGYLGKTYEVFGPDTDKGHFIAHSAGGDVLDSVAWFPQDRRLNRGWSEEGRQFRDMERYCANNPGVFLFSRPLYADRTTRPSHLEFGILRDGHLAIRLFNNRRTPATPSPPPSGYPTG